MARKSGKIPSPQTTGKVLAKVIIEWRKLLKSPHHAISRLLDMAIGEKPWEKKRVEHER